MSLVHAQAQLSSTIANVMARAVETRRTYVETQAQLLVRDGVAQGLVEVEGSGEAVVDIAFPIEFTDPPIFSAGLELRGNASLEWGAFPIWSATVAAWHTENIANNTLVVGATIGIVTFNAARTNLHYSFSGRSYTTPVDSSNSVNQTL